MCGIVGYIGNDEAANIIVEGLRRLEYRGYDSAGVAILNGGDVQLRRSVGKLPALEDLLKQQPVHGTLGLGHTRWATHGKPCEENAHPHVCCKEKIVVVHNGIIENYVELKKELMSKGHIFKSQTDTEVLAHLIEDLYRGELLDAVRGALRRAHGSYALGVLCADDRERFVAARKDSPLVLGVGHKATFLASDVPALLPYTRRVIYLEDGDIARLSKDTIELFDMEGRSVERPIQEIDWDPVMAEKAGFKHFMLKEIHEQRLTIQNTFRPYLSLEDNQVQLAEILPKPVACGVSKVALIACGTSYHAALIARFWFEEIAGIPCDVEIASEQRYRRSNKGANTLVIGVSQSGETADTLAAMRECQAQRLPTLAVCNVVGSSLTRDSDSTLYTQCGPEIGVASTKAFTGQLTALFLIATYMAQQRGKVSGSEMLSLLKGLTHLPLTINHFLDDTSAVEQAAYKIQRAPTLLYLGRHLNYPIALEGALKLKEITYLHAEGFAAGEMKHGPIALIDEGTPVIVLATESYIRDKVLSNIEEVRARGGRVIAIATQGDEEVVKKADTVIYVPAIHEYLAPMLNVVPLQLLAYQVALLRGCDVDQPRNLAKSVTVE